jgi:hypothetical protein
MRILIVALMIVSLTLPAYAQMGSMGGGGMGAGGMGAGGMGGGKGGRKGAAKATSDPNAAKKNMAEEKAYNDALKRIPNKPFDPWGGVRDVPKK